ncbi:cytochrome b5 [Dichomitus squalens LYAD-421 SS1]|uniref:Cytochrome b5 n=1 Tax=Dichomitus squalens TaxID=114155 RepID=A0A4Q9N0N1_9APHY|nr:cytochrome b5 [Dichomitus squalens LYAD-421 SS1]EJF63049.1 cytochrome b5 [Dichomitus squalens LYAD-421 SS1]TBU32206.1 cytochrome b5 [Dichomitus squalens]
MSWFLNPDGDRPQRRRPEKLKDFPKDADGKPLGPQTPGNDPVDPDRKVSTKQANRPFLAYAQYRAEREQAHKEWLQRKQQREEKLARGEEVGPEEPDPTEEVEVGCLGLLKFILYATLFIILAGKFFTGSFLWEQELPNLRQFIPTNQRLFSETLLAQFDGSDPEKPVYIAIDGDVYDVSAGRATYGPGGSYHMMAGKDAARAYGTGCFKTHLTHDLRGLSESEMRGVQHWKKFYAESKKYHKVGRVSHPPIDPASPYPEHCDPKKAEAAREREREAQAEARKHEEL